MMAAIHDDAMALAWQSHDRTMGLGADTRYPAVGLRRRSLTSASQLAAGSQALSGALLPLAFAQFEALDFSGRGLGQLRYKFELARVFDVCQVRLGEVF